MHRKASTPITIVIVGKDPIVGRAIGSLLRTAGYDTRFVADPITNGYRSALVAESLQKMGYTNLKSMDGGFRGWTEKGYPVVKDE